MRKGGEKNKKKEDDSMGGGGKGDVNVRKKPGENK